MTGTTKERLPERLQEIVEDFSFCQGREKLEYLLQFSENLPTLPEWLHEERDNMDQVHECMTPVFMQVENQGGELIYHFDVPKQSPTVRGFASVLAAGTKGSAPADILAIPSEFYREMGLQEVLTSQRLSGMNAILRHMKELAAEEME